MVLLCSESCQAISIVKNVTRYAKTRQGKTSTETKNGHITPGNQEFAAHLTLQTTNLSGL
jgi:hypothetical protein